MPRRRQLKQEDLEGGKINVAKAFKKLGRDIDRGFKKEISRPIQKKIIKPANKKFFKPAQKALAEAGSKIGEFTNKELLPGVVSIAMPLVSTGIGALGAEFGIPPEITSSLSENLMKEFIPKQYQSDNKYVNLISQGLNMAATGDMKGALQLGEDTLGTVAGDIGKLTGKHKVKQQVPTNQYYDPEDPHADLMLQLMSKYQTIPDLQQNQEQPETNQPIKGEQTIDYNSLNDPVYEGADIAEDADSLRITSPPYQQREGSKTGLLGAGIKKRRGRPRKTKVIEEEIEIYTKKKPSYKKFSHAKNSSLEQLLEAKADREEKEAKKAMKEMVSKQTRALTALGFGIGRPKKGSQEAKDKMARLRAMKKK